MAAVDVDGIEKRYGQHVALRGITLAVEHGEVLFLLGPNGAGKTTLLRGLMGLTPMDRGTIRVLGYDVAVAGQDLLVKSQVGYVPEALYLYPALTGKEQLELAGFLHQLPTRHVKHRAQQLLDLVDLSRWGSRPVAEYSMGMRKRLAVACALIHRPQILILDEPTNGLDPFHARMCRELILAHRATGGTTILSSHLLDLGSTLADRIAVLHRGELIAVGTVAELLQRSASTTIEESYLRLTGQAIRTEKVEEWFYSRAPSGL